MPPPPVDLDEIIGSIQMSSGEFRTYLDRQEGRVVTIEIGFGDEGERGDDEDEDDDDAPLQDIPEWQREANELARLVRSDRGDRFIALPDQFDAHEWSMMSAFANGIEDAEARGRLLDAIHGRGAFRMFKDAVGRLGMVDAWRSFKDQQYRKLAIEWCDENKVEWIERPKPSGRSKS